jgi:uncharacterized protein (TIGR03083 family)
MSPVPPPEGDAASDGDLPDAGADLALYTLGALDEIDLRRIETMLVTDGGAAAAEGRLRRIAGAVLAEAAGIDTAPPPSLRSRVLDAARAERPAAEVTSASMSAPAVHRIEGERLVELIRSLAPADWDRPVDPPEFAGWTVHDLVVHLAAVESYFASQIGLDPSVPETEVDNAARTAAAQARHRSLAPSASVDELEQLLLEVADEVDRTAGSIDRALTWWGLEITVAESLVVRSFELWTHAADIARAIGRPEPTPPAPALRAMSTLATGWTPLFLALHDSLLPVDPGAWVRIDLTGPGGTTFDIALDDAAGPATGPPAATVTLDIVDYCKAVGNRIPTGGVAFAHTGDDQVAMAIIASLPMLATL